MDGLKIWTELPQCLFIYLFICYIYFFLFLNFCLHLLVSNFGKLAQTLENYGNSLSFLLKHREITNYSHPKKKASRLNNILSQTHLNIDSIKSEPIPFRVNLGTPLHPWTGEETWLWIKLSRPITSFHER